MQEEKNWDVEASIKEAKEILSKPEQETFIRYRDCGLACINNGYIQGKTKSTKENSKKRKEFIEELNISDQTFRDMITLTNEKLFNSVTVEYSSYYAWSTRYSKPSKKSTVKGNKYLNESGVEWCDYSINIYMGCSHNCSYCYAKAMHGRETLWKGQIEAWDKPKKRDIDLEILKEELDKADKGRIFFCSACDAYQPLNDKLNWAREVLKVLLESKHIVYILTKNTSIERDFDLIKKHKNVQVGFTITSLNDEEYKKYEPNSSLPSERVRVLQLAHMMGITTRVSLEPWIPNFTDPFDIVKRLHKFVDYWWVGTYNYAKVDLYYYQKEVGKLQSLFVELGCKYWFKAELDRIFKSNPILSRNEYALTDAKMVGDQ